MTSPNSAAPKRLLTIQDVSCVGQCSATVALPVVSACGVECAVLPSAVLSNHTAGFKSWTFLDLTSELPRIEAEWRKQDIRFDAFYTGYVCQPQIDPILSIASSCAASGALRIVDPVMADNGKLYPGFGPDFPAQMARLCKGADYILPNLTEAAFLLGREPVLEGYDRAFVEETVAGLHALGSRNVVLTGVSFDPSRLGTAVSDGSSIRYDFNPRLSRSVHGTGDVFASVFAGAILRGLDALAAAALAADVVCASIEATPASHWYGVAFERAIPLLVSRLGGMATAMKLTLTRAKELLATTTSDPHLIVHATNVRGCMEAFARHFGRPPEEVEHWGAVGYLHDYDYERFPEEHLKHTEAELLAEGVDAADVRAIMSHGWGICNDVTPETDLEKSLFCADELSGLVWATALMRPTGISDLEPKSVVKKFKDKKFAAGCNREIIRKGAELVGLDLPAAIAVCIDGMKPYAAETGLLPKT